MPTLGAQVGSREEKQHFLSLDGSVTLDFGWFDATIEILDWVWETSQPGLHDTHSLMLTNGADYIRSQATEENFNFKPGSRQPINQCTQTSLEQDWRSGTLAQDHLSENEMLTCYDGDIGQRLPRPSAEDLADIVERFGEDFEIPPPPELETICVPENDLGDFALNQGLPANTNIEWSYRGDTNEYCTLCMQLANGRCAFPTREAKLNRNKSCLRTAKGQCPNQFCTEKSKPTGDGSSISICQAR